MLRTRPLALALAGSLLAWGTGCDPNIPTSTPPNVVVAQYDPAASPAVLPTPNDLARDPKTGLMSGIPDAPNATDAQKEFNRYLRTLDGFPTTAVATASFDKPVDATNVKNGGVKVAALNGAYPRNVAISLDSTGQVVSVSANWQRATTYAIAVIGGVNGVHGANGEEVVASPVFALLKSRTSLVTGCTSPTSTSCRSATDLITGATPAEAGQKAAQLEQVRLSLQPAFAAFEAQGVDRGTIVEAWTFSTPSQALATFDPANSVVPFPNDLLLDGTGHVNGALVIPPPGPDAGTEDPTNAALRAGLSTLDGFSTTAPLSTEAGNTTGATDVAQAVDGSSLTADQFLLLNLQNPAEQVAVTPSCNTGVIADDPAHEKHACDDKPGAEPDLVAFTPNQPLRSHTKYGAFWLRGATTLDGHALNASPVFALTRLKASLVDGNGKSTVDGVSDEQAAALEPLRAGTSQLLQATDAAGIDRLNVLLAWAFTTETTSWNPAQLPNGLDAVKLRALPILAKLSGAPLGNMLTTGGTPGALTTFDLTALTSAGIPTSHIAWAKEGSFPSLEALDPIAPDVNLATGQGQTIEGSFSAAGLTTPRLEFRRFLLVAPKGTSVTRADGKVPLIIFQHGLGGNRRQMLLMADEAAAAGFGVLAIDMPLHGARSYCRADAECNTSCDTDPADASGPYYHRCVPSGTPGVSAYKAVNDPVKDPIGTILQSPLISGRDFLSAANLFATRDHFRQQIIDYSAMMLMLETPTMWGPGGPASLGTAVASDGTTPLSWDTTNPRYIGQSLGGITGGILMAAIPEMQSGVLNVPGASLLDIVLNSPSFTGLKAQLDGFLDSKGLKTNSQGYDQFLSTARWILDPADPQNFGRHLIAEPLTSYPVMAGVPALDPAVYPKKRIFVSWMIDDQTVPNLSTDLLRNSIVRDPGSPYYQELPYTGGSHGFLLDWSNPQLAVSAQLDAITWVNQ